MNPYAILGLSSNATEEQVRKAYRKLASKHHPDKGGNTATFQNIQVAYDAIEKAGFRNTFSAPPPPRQEPPGAARKKPNWEPPKSPGDTWRDKPDVGDIFQEMKAANKAADPANRNGYDYTTHTSEPVANVTLREAFSGFNMAVPRHQRGGMITHDTVHIPPGIPNGFRDNYATTSGNRAYVTVRIDTGKFKLKSLADQDNLFSAGLQVGDLELEMDLDAIDLISGTWIRTEDFLGEKLEVRVPEGFNPLHRLKIAGKGYYGWLHEYGRPSNNRQDMYIKINPIYKRVSEIDPQKIVDLYNKVQGMI